MDVYTYKLGNDTYINLTNKCTNDCTFCIRNSNEGVGGYHLWLEKEPTAQQVISELAKDKSDVVFCGYGEPTIKLDELVAIARYVKGYGGYVRLNTNGHANEYHGRNVVPELKDVVDEVSISLNEADATKYNMVTNCEYGEAGYEHMLDFARLCVQSGIKVVFSVVDVISQEDIETCQKLSEKMGATFRLRHYVE